jgi:pyrimidine-nucleoside phosphorylase
MNYVEIFNKIEEGNLFVGDLNNILSQDIKLKGKNEQFLSALCHILLKDETSIEIISNKLDEIKNDEIKNQIIHLLNVIDNKKNLNSLYYKLYKKEELDEYEIQSIVNMSLMPESYSLNLTVILNLIKFCGLSLDNIYLLSLKMAKSGKIFDYRNIQRLNNKKIVRRYPTGGVSEKIALIMPSLLKCLSKKYDFVSPFLVAKTLGFTGGTWDKLSSIPDFYFPKPGNESINILEKENVCMTVAKGAYNPSDTYLYQLRSITNTVNSLPLIITSIASKQIANPVDTLLLDIRYGENAFLNTIDSAKDFYKQTKLILDKFNINTIAQFTNTNRLLGLSIGNYLEVIESICIMKNQTSYSKYLFDYELLEEQKKLVVLMASELISSQFGLDISKAKDLCHYFFESFEVFGAFKELLISHKVKDTTISKIEKNQDFYQSLDLEEFPIYAHKTGVIEEINQRNIGNFVNMILGAGSNYFNDEDKLYDCVLIRKKQFSEVRKNEVIASIFSTNFVDTRSLSDSFFKIN